MMLDTAADDGSQLNYFDDNYPRSVLRLPCHTPFDGCSFLHTSTMQMFLLHSIVRAHLDDDVDGEDVAAVVATWGIVASNVVDLVVVAVVGIVAVVVS
jgi:hypothetical protein